LRLLTRSSAKRPASAAKLMQPHCISSYVAQDEQRLALCYIARVDALLPESFYARESLEVALDLIGRYVRHGDVTLRITEVEAYRYPGDTANHCRFGKTARNAPMWGPPGRAYVYLCYGLHQMLNLVTDADGRGAAVLVRACEPIAGTERIRARRGGRGQGSLRPLALTGPGKVGSALAIDTTFSGRPLFVPGGLELLEGAKVRALLVGPRVGVDYAEPAHRAAPWRVAAADSAWVSHPKTLAPLRGSLARFLAAQRLA
jgi:DNA-3-methyladenine glycosylase